MSLIVLLLFLIVLPATALFAMPLLLFWLAFCGKCLCSPFFRPLIFFITLKGCLAPLFK
jgi:hypothetical protein